MQHDGRTDSQTESVGKKSYALIQEKRVNCGNSRVESDNIRALDNLSARTSLLETKLVLLENGGREVESNVRPRLQQGDPKTINVVTNSSSHSPLPRFDVSHNDTLTSVSSHREILKGSKENVQNSSHFPSESLLSNGSSAVSMPKEGTEPSSFRNISRMSEDNENHNSPMLSTRNETSVDKSVIEIQPPVALNTGATGDVHGSSLNHNSSFQSVSNGSRNPNDQSIILLSTPLVEQRARIEALFHETSTALRRPTSDQMTDEKSQRSSMN